MAKYLAKSSCTQEERPSPTPENPFDGSEVIVPRFRDSCVLRILIAIPVTLLLVGHVVSGGAVVLSWMMFDNYKPDDKSREVAIVTTAYVVLLISFIFPIWLDRAGKSRLALVALALTIIGVLLFPVLALQV